MVSRWSGIYTVNSSGVVRIGGRARQFRCKSRELRVGSFFWNIRRYEHKKMVGHESTFVGKKLLQRKLSLISARQWQRAGTPTRVVNHLCTK